MGPTMASAPLKISIWSASAIASTVTHSNPSGESAAKTACSFRNLRRSGVRRLQPVRQARARTKQRAQSPHVQDDVVGKPLYGILVERCFRGRVAQLRGDVAVAGVAVKGVAIAPRRLAVALLAREDQPDVVAVERRGRTERDRPVEQNRRRLTITPVMDQQAQKMMRIGVVRRELQDFPKQPLGLVEAALGIEGDRPPWHFGSDGRRRHYPLTPDLARSVMRRRRPVAANRGSRLGRARTRRPFCARPWRSRFSRPDRTRDRPATPADRPMTAPRPRRWCGGG